MTKSAAQILRDIEKAEFRILDLEEVLVWVENPRDNENASEHLAEAIREVGYGAPIVVQKKRRRKPRAGHRLIAGHTRRKAAVKIGLPRLPAFLVDVSDSVAEKMALADNRQSEFSRWRPVELHELLGRHSSDVLSRLGWEPPDLEALKRELPNFEPTAPPEKRLDETTPIVCPNCGHEWNRA